MSRKISPSKLRGQAAETASTVIHGRWLSSRFFRRNWGGILAIMIMLIVYIAARYQCLAAMEQIQSLEKELKAVRSEEIRQKALYLKQTRETVITQRAHQRGLDLEMRHQPPFHISLNP